MINRRELFGAIGAFAAALSLPRLVLADVKPEKLDFKAIVDQFVAAKVAAGYKDLFLLKNLSGQFIFALYDSKTGSPTAIEHVYLLYGKPTNNKSGILPPAGRVGQVFGCHAMAVEFDFTLKPKDVRTRLNAAFTCLTWASKRSI